MPTSVQLFSSKKSTTSAGPTENKINSSFLDKQEKAQQQQVLGLLFQTQSQLNDLRVKYDFLVRRDARTRYFSELFEAIGDSKFDDKVAKTLSEQQIALQKIHDVLCTLEDEYGGFCYFGIVNCEQNRNLVPKQYDEMVQLDGKSFLHTIYSPNTPSELQEESLFNSFASRSFVHATDDNFSPSSEKSANFKLSGTAMRDEYLRTLISKTHRKLPLYEDLPEFSLVPCIYNKMSVGLLCIVSDSIEDVESDVLLSTLTKMWTTCVLRSLNDEKISRAHELELSSLRKQVHEANRMKQVFTSIMSNTDDADGNLSASKILKKRLSNVANFLEERYGQGRALVFIAPLDSQLNQSLITDSKGSKSDLALQDENYEENSSFMLYIFSDAARQIRRSVMRDYAKPSLKNSKLFQKVINKQTPVYYRDTSSLTLPSYHFPMSSCALVPIVSNSKTVALLGIANMNPASFSDDELVILFESIGTCWLSALASTFSNLNSKYNQSLVDSTMPSFILEKYRLGDKNGEKIDEISTIYAGFVDFAEKSSHVNPSEVIEFLNHIFNQFDAIASKYHVDRLKIVNGGAMYCNNISKYSLDTSVVNIVAMTLEMMDTVDDFNSDSSGKWSSLKPVNLRIGVSTGGPVVCGLFGSSNNSHSRIQFDVIGHVLNLSQRLESSTKPGSILCCPRTRTACGDSILFDEGTIYDLKGIGSVEAYTCISKNKD